ncbi:MAG: phenylalanine--tRNA ligase subunit alpha, partial [Chloroflexi bacterium]|nr:phenylalanine--tRNA ligase subunit alpha [Chloroflexota bacterium]
MLEELRALGREAEERLAGLETVEALEEWHHTYLGRRGALTQTLRGIGRLSAMERPLAGQAANEIKQSL